MRKSLFALPLAYSFAVISFLLAGGNLAYAYDPVELTQNNYPINYDFDDYWCIDPAGCYQGEMLITGEAGEWGYLIFYKEGVENDFYDCFGFEEQNIFDGWALYPPAGSYDMITTSAYDTCHTCDNLTKEECLALPTTIGSFHFTIGGSGAILAVPEGGFNDLLAGSGVLFTDLWPILALFIGIPLAFYIINKVLDIKPK